MLGFHVSKHVPDGARRRVAESVQGHPRGFHVLLRQMQILLDSVQDCFASWVDAEVVDCLLKVGDVGFLAFLQNLAGDEVGGEFQLLGERKDFGSQCCDIGLEGIPCFVYELPGEGHSDDPISIFRILDALKTFVIRCLVGSHQFHQAVFGYPSVTCGIP